MNVYTKIMRTGRGAAAAHARYRLGKLQVEKGQNKKALETFRENFETSKGQWAVQSRFERGMLLSSMNRNEEAIAEFLAVVYVHKDDAHLDDQALLNAASIYEKIRKPEQAEKLYMSISSSTDATVRKRARQAIERLKNSPKRKSAS